MKLVELFPDPNDFFDPADMGQIEDRQGLNADAAKIDKQPAKKSPGRDSNVTKAKRIRNLSRMKARDANPGQGKDTPHQYNLGGHFTTWLDRGGHG